MKTLPDTLKKKLALIVGVDNKQFTKGMDNISKKIKSASKTISKWAKRAALGIAAIGIAAIKLGMNFDTAMRNVWTLLKISRGEFDRLKDQVLELSKVVPQTATDLATALYQLVSAQIPAAERMKVLEMSAKAATAGLSTTTEAAEALITVIKGYPKGTISAKRAADLLFKTIELGITTFSELSASLSELMPAVIVAGLGFEEVSAAIATLTGQKVPTAQAMTALNRLFFSLVTPTKLARKELEKLIGAGDLRGLDLLKGKITDMSALLKDLSKLGPQAMRAIVPREQGIKAMILLTKFRETYEANFAKMQDASGSMEAAFDKQMGSFQNKLKIIWSVIQVTANRIFEVLEKDVGKGLDYVKERFEILVGWVEANKERLTEAVGNFASVIGKVTKAVAGLAFAIATNKVLIIGFFTTLVAIKFGGLLAHLGLLSGALALLRVGVFALYGAIIAVPLLGSVIFGIGLAAIGGYELYKHLTKTRTEIEKIGESVNDIPRNHEIQFTVVDATKAGLDQVKESIKEATGELKKGVTDAMELFPKSFTIPYMKIIELGELMLEVKPEEDILSRLAILGGLPRPEERVPFGAPAPTEAQKVKAIQEAEWSKYLRGLGAGIPKREIPGLPSPTTGELPLPPELEKEMQRERELRWSRELSEIQKMRADEEIERLRIQKMQYIDMSSVALSAMTGMYEGIARASERFFRGDLNNAKQWGAAYEMIGRSVAASMVRSVGDILSAKAILWAKEGLAALGMSLSWNPFTAGAGAAHYFAAAAGAGVGAGIAYGAAGAISGAGEEHYAGAFGEDTMAGEGGARATGEGRSRYGATTTAVPKAIYYNPSVTITGETILIGRMGIDDLKFSLGQAMVEAIKDAQEGGELDLARAA